MAPDSTVVLLSLMFSVHAAGALPESASVATLITTPLVIEGLTNDNADNLYAPGRNAGAGMSCPVWRTSIAAPGLTMVGLIPAPSATAQCSPSGLAFGPDGMLY